MAHFYFDLRNGTVLERDETGIDLPDFESAYLEAHRAAIDIWAEARREGRKPDYRCFEVRSSRDTLVFELPFAEALDIRLESLSAHRHPHGPSHEQIKAELGQTEARITLGERHIADQRARIARMEEKGYSAALRETC